MSAQSVAQLKTSAYSDTSVTNAKLGLNAVQANNLQDGSVSFTKLATSGRRYDVHTSQVITANVTLGAGDLNAVLLVDCAASRVIDLPSTASGIVVGDWIKICSVSGSTSTNNIIINPGAGSSINANPAGDRLRMDIDDSAVTLVYAGSNNWELIEKVF